MGDEDLSNKELTLEERVARIEAYLGLNQPGSLIKRAKTTAIGETSGDLLEYKIGEYWLAQIGAIVLLLGIAFFISYPLRGVPGILAALIGYVAVGALFLLSALWKKSYNYLSKILFSGSLVLLYFATTRLHFFTDNPLITSKALCLVLLLGVLGLNFYLAAKRQSQVLANIIFVQTFTTALISDSPIFAFTLIVLASAFALFCLAKYNWQTTFIMTVVVACFTHILLLLDNPILGGLFQPMAAHHFNLAFLVAYSLLFAAAALFNKKNKLGEFFEITLAILNGGGIFVIGGMNILFYFKTSVSLFSLATALFFIGIAILHWATKKDRYSISYYACFSHIALSAAIFTAFSYPNYFIWLSLQSLLVIFTALWFHSRIIVVANILIYLTTLLAYFVFAPSHNFVNLSYAFTALTSARVLNWQKNRLELKTELIRNIYLVCAFFIVLYGLMRAVPAPFVSLSWIGAAVFYFGTSVWLKNIKYRYMAIFTIFATVGHILIIDLATQAAGFRIVSFVVVGVIILILSILYARYRRKVTGSTPS